jgi:hypothetical protein
MPETTWNIVPRVDQFAETEGYGLDAWDMTSWGNPTWQKAVRESTVWVKES